MALTGPLKKQGPVKWVAVIPAHNITCGGLCSYSAMWCGFFLVQNITFLSTDTAINCILIGGENLWAGCSIQESVQQCVTCITVSIPINIWQIFVNFGWYSFKFLVWSCIFDNGAPNPDGYVVKCVFLCLLYGQSLIILRVNPCVSQAGSVASMAVTECCYHFLPACGFLCTHTLAFMLSSTK